MIPAPAPPSAAPGARCCEPGSASKRPWRFQSAGRWQTSLGTWRCRAGRGAVLIDQGHARLGARARTHPSTSAAPLPGVVSRSTPSAAPRAWL